MTDWSKIEEGGDAYRNWFGQEVLTFPAPSNPYPEGSDEHQSWQCGYDGAENWQLYDQYLPDGED